MRVDGVQGRLPFDSSRVLRALLRLDARPAPWHVLPNVSAMPFSVPAGSYCVRMQIFVVNLNLQTLSPG